MPTTRRSAAATCAAMIPPAAPRPTTHTSTRSWMIISLGLATARRCLRWCGDCRCGCDQFFRSETVRLRRAGDAEPCPASLAPVAAMAGIAQKALPRPRTDPPEELPLRGRTVGAPGPEHRVRVQTRGFGALDAVAERGDHLGALGGQ